MHVSYRGWAGAAPLRGGTLKPLEPGTWASAHPQGRLLMAPWRGGQGPDSKSEAPGGECDVVGVAPSCTAALGL